MKTTPHRHEWKARLRPILLFIAFVGGISLLIKYGGDNWPIIAVFVGALGLGAFLFAVLRPKVETD